MYTVNAIKLDSNKMIELNSSGAKSLLTLQNLTYSKHNAELDIQTTLENYFDHAWIADNILLIENDYSIMSMPIHRLFNDYGLYNIVEDMKAKFL